MRSVFAAFLFCSACVLSAQSGEDFERIFAMPKMLWRDAVRIVSVAAGESDERRAVEDIFLEAKRRRWIPEDAVQDETPRLDDIAHLLVRAFAVKGSLARRYINHRYFSFRLLRDKKIIDEKNDPGAAVGPDEFFYILGKIR